jgi:uncharacterized protein
VIVLDSNVLIYAKGEGHPLRDPCRALVEAIASGNVQATTTTEAIQEFVHVRARRRPREDAAALGRSYATLLSPLLPVREDDLRRGLELFEHHPELGAFDAVLAAATIASRAEAIVSADRTFAQVADLRHIDPGSPSFDQLLGS